MADDLEENYLIEPDFEPENREISDDEELDNDEEPEQPVKKQLKTSQNNSLTNESKKKNKKKNITEVLKLKEDEFNGPKFPIEEFKKHLTKYINDNLSSVEKNELKLDKNLDKRLLKMILKRQKTYNLPIHKQFSKKFNKKLELYKQKRSDKNKKSPFMVVLCSSAIRCIEIQKALDKHNKHLKSKSLRWIHAFAKHKKLNEQIKFIKDIKYPIDIVYATPQRLSQLTDLEANAIDFKNLKYVLVDYTYRDCKQKRILDIPDIKNDFFKLFFQKLIHLNKKKIKVKFYLA